MNSEIEELKALCVRWMDAHDARRASSIIGNLQAVEARFFESNAALEKIERIALSRESRIKDLENRIRMLYNDALLVDL